jgi:hypothetical protein
LGPCLHPLLKTVISLLGTSSGEETLDADVFIEVRPMDALALPDQLVMLPLLPCAV